ncbi:MAG: pseudouridine synthase, partial [Bacteroidota bacterium]|nr:pseudouridine synthase [Bacteroidota bacterium]
MVSQFVSNDDVRLLGDLNYSFPEGTHAIGRLDNNSEGLLILSTNKKLTRLLFQSEVPHKRKYLVQVNNSLSNESVACLRHGITFKSKGGIPYQTLPCEANITDIPENLFTNGKVINENQQTCWLYLTLTEGKYHQVRKMIKAVRHRCLRLIRISIENLELGNLQPGEVLEVAEAELFSKLR